MPIFDPSFAPQARDSQSVLVGIAQVRIAGQTSIRSTMTAASGAWIAAGKSTVITDSTDGTTELVRPQVPYAANAGTGLPTVSGTYTGNYDGCFILRLTSGTAGKLYAPDGSATTVAAVAPIAQTSMGLTFAGTITGGAAGDTFVIPVISGVAQNTPQTGIISPYSMFKGAANSVGALSDSSFDPKIDGISTLESGFPTQVNDQIITKVSSTIKFGAFEFTSTLASVLRDMMDSAMNGGDIKAVAAEVVFRDRGGRLLTYWCPSCTLASVPSIGPKNDFSSVTWELKVNDQVEGTATGTYAAWLRNSQMYYTLQYTH